MLEDSCLYSSVPVETVTYSNPYAPFHTIRAALWTEKLSVLSKTMSLSEQCAVSKVTTSVRSTDFRPWHRPAIVLPDAYCPVNNTLFKLNPAVRVCQVATVVMETTQLVLSKSKNFIVVNWELNSVSLYQKQKVKVIWQKAPHGGPIPRLWVTPGGRNLYHWIPWVGVPISVP